MLLNVSINCWDGKWAGLSEEQYTLLREAIPQFPAEKPDNYWKDLILDEDGIRALSNIGLSVDLRPMEESCMLVKLQDRLTALGVEVRDMQTAVVNGCAAQIHIPDLALMRVNEVTWLDDARTEDLQQHLDEGWRILAVCPPNARRRPDYILGRTKVKVLD